MRAAAVGGLAFQVLAGGMLSGRFRADESPAAKTRMGSRAIYRSRYWNESSFATVERLRAVSAEAGRTPSALAIAWVLSRPGIGGVLFGASNAAQLDDAASASAEPMEVSESAAVDAAVAP